MTRLDDTLRCEFRWIGRRARRRCEHTPHRRQVVAGRAGRGRSADADRMNQKPACFDATPMKEFRDAPSPGTPASLPHRTAPPAASRRPWPRVSEFCRMAKRMLIDATHPEETRVVVLSGNRLEEFDFESSTKKQVKGNIYLAKVTRVEPSLQAAFVDYGGNRHGFLAFSEIHPDYYRIPVSDRGAAEDDARRPPASDASELPIAGQYGHRRRRHEATELAGRRRRTADAELAGGRRRRQAERIRRAAEDSADMAHEPTPIERWPNRARRRRRGTRRAIRRGRRRGRRGRVVEPEEIEVRATVPQIGRDARRRRGRGGRGGRRGERRRAPPDAPLQDPGGHQAPPDHAGAGRQGGARQQGRGADDLSVAGRTLLRADAEHQPRRRRVAQDHQHRRPPPAQGHPRRPRHPRRHGGHRPHRRRRALEGRDQARLRIPAAAVERDPRPDAAIDRAGADLRGRQPDQALDPRPLHARHRRGAGRGRGGLPHREGLHAHADAEPRQAGAALSRPAGRAVPPLPGREPDRRDPFAGRAAALGRLHRHQPDRGAGRDRRQFRAARRASATSRRPRCAPTSKPPTRSPASCGCATSPG